ncbi:WD repeat-containing protein 7 [Carex littledalei]|uniref:WD repeat-containing protein 7 n=1 Tax=Carex littledalei TaxID=544730 RepID=A0A833R4Q7_9POAL|nr:WD repeat-containing protein 7 [Carex littledalei]
MKCPSVAALWASTPPSHQITAAAVLPSAFSLFTGGSDGAIIRWSVSAPSILPICLLSGHAASISSLTATSTSSLLSTCTAGVLCLWSATASSRCRRRRKLPPWSGTPLIVKSDPLSSSHVFVLCGSAEHGGSHPQPSRKYVVMIVDCVSLNVVKSVFHGGLSIGSPLEMGVFGSEVLLIDGNGRIQLLDVSESSDMDGLEGSVVSCTSTSSDAGSMSTGENSEGLIQAVASDQEGRILALVYASRCLLKWVAEGNVIGEISIVGSSLCREESNDKLITGIFLPDASFNVRDTGDDGIFRSLALCSNNGTAMFYSISIVGNLFDYKPVCEIPPTSSTVERRDIFSFCQFNEFLVRIESECITVGESLLWQPYISTWSFESLYSSSYLSKKILEGGFPCEKSISNGRIVSSSMVLSEDSFVPYAIVYGFYTGEIEVIRFLESMTGIGGIFPHISDNIISGHTGPVLCLASHHMHTQGRFTRALMSGSKDCTVRVWDLDTGILLAVMHHHVASVRQIILPPEWTYQPWNDCFLSVGDDDCVALVSLETLRVERVFPGHIYYPSMVAWDGNKGYIACLCRNLKPNTDTVSLLYIWDLKTGALERVTRGAASNSMFDHFCNNIYKNTIAGGILGGTTSASSLLLPVFKDPKSSKKANKIILNLQQKGPVLRSTHDIRDDMLGLTAKQQHGPSQKAHQEKKKVPIKCSCPFPGIASLRFDLAALMSPLAHVSCHLSKETAFRKGEEVDSPAKESPEGRLLRFSLCFLHLWGVDTELDRLLVEEMNVCKPDVCHITAGIIGDRGAMSLMFPGVEPTLEVNSYNELIMV